MVSGFTTNPSLMKNFGAKNYKAYSKKILKICKNKPVSLEVFADDLKKQNAEMVNIDWSPPARGNIELANILAKLSYR